MKLKFDKPKRARIKHRFLGFTTFEVGWWFSHDLNRWEPNPGLGENGYSSNQTCRSVRAFRRKLKKAPKGIDFILVSMWQGFDVFGVGNR
jgi:hypothetical protein